MVINAVALSITSLSELYSDDTIKIFEFAIFNNNSVALDNVSWDFDTDDSLIINSTKNIVLAVNEYLYVYLKYNFSTGGIFNVNVTASNASISDTESLTVNVSDLIITDFKYIYLDQTEFIFEIKATNLGVIDSNNINWSLNFTDGNIINSTKPFNLTSNEEIFIYAHYNFTVSGYYNVTAKVFNSDSYTSIIEVRTNATPVIAALPNVTFDEDGHNDTIDLDVHVTDEDIDADLTWTAVGNSSSTVIVEIFEDHTINISGASDYNNEPYGKNITFIVTDMDGFTSNDTILVIVKKMNDPPNITWYTPADLTPSVAINSELLFNHTSEDVDSPVLTYNWTLDGITQSTSQSWKFQPSGGNEGLQNVSIIVTDSFDLSDSQNWTVNVTNIDVYDLSLLNPGSSEAIFEFKITNNNAVDLTNINWSLNTGLETIYSTELINLTVGETVFVFVQYEYNQSGNYTITAKSENSITSDEESINVSIGYIGASDLMVLYNNSKERIFQFIITNYFTMALTDVNWTLYTGENLIAANQLATLEPDESLFVFVDYNYTSNDTYNVIATAINGSVEDSTNLSVTIS